MTMTNSAPRAADALGMDLGRRTVTYEPRDAQLYALALGTPADRLDLVYERDLRVLPTYGVALGLWACDVLGGRGYFDPRTAVQGAQRLEVLAPLPTTGGFEATGRVAAVWDKGSAAVFEIEVESAYFRATYVIFAPGAGGFGGERGPGSPADPEGEPAMRFVATTDRDQAALYRLTGDRHAIHIDPAAAEAIGQPRPILHGLCTLGVVLRTIADATGAHPADLESASARFALPVLPGDDLHVARWAPGPDGRRTFAATTDRGLALSGGSVRFATPTPTR